MSRRVSGRAVCPWRLYYTRYYSGPDYQHQPTSQDANPVGRDLPLGVPDTADTG